MTFPFGVIENATGTNTSISTRQIAHRRRKKSCRGRQVHGNGSFPHAALSAGDRDKIFYAFDGQFGGLRLRCWCRWHFQFLRKEKSSGGLNVKLVPGGASTRFYGSASCEHSF